MANYRMSPHKAAKPMVWVKDKSGNTYICPISAVKNAKDVSDEELRYCVNESENPQNN